MYDSSLKARWDYENTIAFAAEVAGKKALEKGAEQGIIQGEHNKALSIGMKLKTAGTPPKQISELTGLTLEEVEAL